MNFTDKQLLMLLGAGFLVSWYIKNKAMAAVESTIEVVSETADTVIEAVNPVDENNLANRGVNWVVQSLTGDENQSLGGLAFDGVEAIKEWW